jgi:hypothetical protein
VLNVPLNQKNASRETANLKKIRTDFAGAGFSFATDSPDETLGFLHGSALCAGTGGSDHARDPDYHGKLGQK